MKHLPHLAGRLYASPWAILPESHAELSALYRNYLAGQLPAALDRAERVSSGVAYEFDDRSGIAILHIGGIIAKQAPDIPCGPQIADLAKIDRVIEAVRAEERVETLILNIDSPGGSGQGLEETAQNLRELAEEVRLIAYSDAMACSAAYWLAAAADEIYFAPSAMVGSIGSYIAAIDDTRMWEMEGLELKLFRSGSLKAVGHPGKSWTKEEEEWLTQMNDDCGRRFREWVTARRGPVPEGTMQGQWFEARAADAASLSDGFHRSLDRLVAWLMAGAE